MEWTNGMEWWNGILNSGMPYLNMRRLNYYMPAGACAVTQEHYHNKAWMDPGWIVTHREVTAPNQEQ